MMRFGRKPAVSSAHLSHGSDAARTFKASCADCQRILAEWNRINNQAKSQSRR